MRIEFARPSLGEAEWRGVKAVLESGWVTQGPVVAQFERAVAQLCGAQHAVAVTSCTTALHLSLITAGVQPGDEVLVPSMSFIAAANAVVHAGGVPVFCEVDPVTFNLDVKDAERRITARTRAVLFADQLGIPAPIEEIRSLAAEANLKVVEDAACAIGSSYRGAPVGSHCDWVCFSFHPRKVITTGEGGMIMTPHLEIADRLRRLRHHGMSMSDLERHHSDRFTRETYAEIGFNYRMTDIQAAIGLEQLRRLPRILAQRKELAGRYDAALAGHPLIETPVLPLECDWNVQTYAVRLRDVSARQRDDVIQLLLERGIASRAGVMTAHRERAYRKLGFVLPVSEKASDGSLQLPLHPGMTPEDCLEVATELTAAVESTVRGAL